MSHHEIHDDDDIIEVDDEKYVVLNEQEALYLLGELMHHWFPMDRRDIARRVMNKLFRFANQNDVVRRGT